MIYTHEKPIPLVAVVGPTASGKTSFAVRLAKHFGTEIIHADSQQVYKGMDIGTSKPTEGETAAVKHHLLSILPPDHIFSAEDFCKRAAAIIKRLHSDGKLSIVEGGSGFYLRSLVDGLFSSPAASPVYRKSLRKREEDGEIVLFDRLEKIDPEAAKRIHRNDRIRIIRALEVYHLTGIPISLLQRKATKRFLPVNPVYIGLLWPRDILYERINLRVDRMMEAGFVDEVRNILEAGYAEELPSMRALGYSQISAYLRKEQNLETTIYEIKQKSRHYAKRQMTWFRKNRVIFWLNPLENNFFQKAVDFITKSCVS